MADTTIEWTEKSWNPVRGCEIVSPGCKRCYAMRQAHRHAGKGKPYQGLTWMTKAGPVWTGEAREIPEKLDEPKSWKKPARIFVNSMSDLFHEDVTPEFIARVFAVMAECPQHTFQILTKRAERMQRLLAHDLPYEGPQWPLKNVWMGVSVEDQQRADERVPELLTTPAAVRWLSCEPLLGPVDLLRWRVSQSSVARALSSGKGKPSIDWVVVGGESGPGARPMHPDWARLLREQCSAAGVPFFFKQWGAWSPNYDFDARHIQIHRNGTTKGGLFPDNRDGWELMNSLGKKLAGRLLDGVEYSEYPQ